MAGIYCICTDHVSTNFVVCETTLTLVTSALIQNSVKLFTSEIQIEILNKSLFTKTKETNRWIFLLNELLVE